MTTLPATLIGSGLPRQTLSGAIIGVREAVFDNAVFDAAVFDTAERETTRRVRLPQVFTGSNANKSLSDTLTS